MTAYNPRSSVAEEFINDGEIRDTLRYAEENKNNRELITSIIEKARDYKGLNHREALLLLECAIPELNGKMFELALEIKKKIYGSHRLRLKYRSMAATARRMTPQT